MKRSEVRLPAKISANLARVLGGEHVYLLVVAAIIGVLGGFGAHLFRELIYAVRHFSFPGGYKLGELYATAWYWKVLPPAIGGLIVGPLVYFFAREAKGHGIPEVMNSVSNRGGRIRKRVMAVKTLASAITIGTGGSVGREGPIVQIGAGLGSSVGQALGFDGNRLIVLLGCGAAAGMAATFNAPIAGVILAIEVIIGTASISVFSPLVVASVAGTVVMRMMVGDKPFVEVPDYALLDPATELPLYVLLGIAAGLVALFFTKGIVWLEDLWEKIKLPEWATPMIGGAVVGAIALYFPQVLGVGYETIDLTLNGKFVDPAIDSPINALWLLAALVVVKIVASGVTLGSGGSGGVFAPALFVGACLGGAFGLAVEQLLPGQTAHFGAYALVGMGAVLAGATHAPITAIIMLFEITGNYTIILPLMLSCIISLALATRTLPTSIFTTRLLRQGVRLRSSSEAELMRVTKIRRIFRPFAETVRPATPLKDIIQKALTGAILHQYVVDDDNRVLGVITLRRLRLIFAEGDMDENLLVAADIMKTPVTTVSLDDTLSLAMAHISRMDIEMLPVIDDEGRLAGTVTRHDMMVFFEHEILKDNQLGLKFVSSGQSEEQRFVEVPEGHQVEVIEVTPFISGKSLRELDLRATAGINVLGIRRSTSEGIERVSPDPKEPLQTGDAMVVVGELAAINSFKNAIKS